MTQLNKFILIPPGGPAGPFWGVMRQSGLIVAMQIMERQDAQLLVTIGNIADGDARTIGAITDCANGIFSETLEPMTLELDTEYLVNVIVKAIGEISTEPTK